MTPKTYRKIPETVKVIRFNREDHEEIKKFLGEDYLGYSVARNPDAKMTIQIQAARGVTVYAREGDYITENEDGNHGFRNVIDFKREFEEI